VKPFGSLLSTTLSHRLKSSAVKPWLSAALLPFRCLMAVRYLLNQYREHVHTWENSRCKRRERMLKRRVAARAAVTGEKRVERGCPGLGANDVGCSGV
jgi:hypothetical protein